MKTGKMDRRHNGYTHFRYYASFLVHETERFIDTRNWCWQNWGPSAELGTGLYMKKDLKWAWNYDQYSIKLYFQDDPEYQWFLLKWH